MSDFSGDPLAEWRKKDLEDERGHLRVLESEYKDSKNPLFAWEAISRINDRPELVAGHSKKYPAWVMEYLAQSAKRTRSVAGGLNYLGALKIDRTDATLEEKWALIGKTIPPAERLQQVLELLGFCSPGKNAFSEYDARYRLIYDLSDYVTLLDEGMTDRLRKACGGAVWSDSSSGCGPERREAGWPSLPARRSATRRT